MRDAILKEIKRRLEVCEAATKGPWTLGHPAETVGGVYPEADPHGEWVIPPHDPPAESSPDFPGYPEPPKAADWTFIAASREWTPAALRFAERELGRHKPGTDDWEQTCESCCEAFPCPTWTDAAECFGVKE